MRSLEDNKSGSMKIEANVSFIKTCKTEQLIPTFAKVKLSINNVNRKLQCKMFKLVMEAELKDKHNSKKKLKDIIRKLTFVVKRKASFILFNAIISTNLISSKVNQKLQDHVVRKS